ncbi:MAG: SHOCT domain-containing protein [Candidatus Lernaella stagnicola]|nr:SHOCT domain-containing protein [Candidatus Lernaella stagnicola]
MIGYLIAVIVFGTTIWVGFDAKANKITVTDKPYSGNNGAVAWVLSCLFLWIVCFPLYLSKRSKQLAARTAPAKTPPAGVAKQELADIKQLLDDDLITVEDYEAKKRQLLGL